MPQSSQWYRRLLVVVLALALTGTAGTLAHAAPSTGAGQPTITVQGSGFNAKNARSGLRAVSCTPTRFQACALNAGARVTYIYPQGDVPAILGIPITIVIKTTANRNDIQRTVNVGPAQLESGAPLPAGTTVRLDFSDIGFEESVTLEGVPGAQADEQSYTYNPGVGSGVASFALTIEGEATFPDRRQVLDRDVSQDSTVRCDNKAYGSTIGCVNPAVEAVLTEMQNLPNIRAYIKRKIANFGSPTRVRRLTDLQAQRRNRDAVCSRSVVGPPPQEHPDWTCDEYPFAATYEGGQNGGVYGNVEFVPAEEQGQQRAYLTNVVARANRVIDGEYYNVVV